MKFPHRKVPKHVALNPVARAVAWANLQRYSLDAKIKLYLLEEGEDCEEWAMPLARYFTMVLVAVEHDRRRSDPEIAGDYQCVALGQQAFVVISQQKWGFLQGWVPQIEAAIDAGARIVPKLTPQAVNYAWKTTH